MRLADNAPRPLRGKTAAVHRFQPASRLRNPIIESACEADEIAVCDKDEVMAIYRRSEDDVFSCVRGLW